jgi:hypothetical protein
MVLQTEDESRAMTMAAMTERKKDDSTVLWMAGPMATYSDTKTVRKSMETTTDWTKVWTTASSSGDSVLSWKQMWDQTKELQSVLD